MRKYISQAAHTFQTRFLGNLLKKGCCRAYIPHHNPPPHELQRHFTNLCNLHIESAKHCVLYGIFFSLQALHANQQKITRKNFNGRTVVHKPYWAYNHIINLAYGSERKTNTH